MAAVPEYDIAHISHTVAVHQHTSGGNGTVLPAGVTIQFQYLTDVADENIGRIHAHVFRQLLVLHQMVVFSVDGHEEFRLGQCVDQLQFFLTGVAGYMHNRFVVVYVDAFFIHFVDDLANQLFVAGNGVGGQHHQILGGQLHLRVIRKGHPVQCRHGFALAAGGDDGDLFLGIPADVRNVNKHPLRHIHVAQPYRRSYHIQHTPPGDSHFPAESGAGIDDLLYTVDVGGEGRNDNPLVGVGHEDVIQRSAYLPFGGSEARLFHVGGFAHQQQHAFSAVFPDTGQIHHFPADGRNVQLEVPGVEDGAFGGTDGDHAGVCNGVVGPNEFTFEYAQPQHGARFHGDQFPFPQQTMFRQLVFQDPQGQTGTVHRHIQRLQQIGQTADMVFMPVGQQDTPDPVGILFQIGIIRNHQIHPQHIFVRERQTAVDDDHIFFVFDDGQILTDLVQAAQHHDFDLACGMVVLFSCHKNSFLSILIQSLYYRSERKFMRMVCYISADRSSAQEKRQSMEKKALMRNPMIRRRRTGCSGKGRSCADMK